MLLWNLRDLQGFVFVILVFAAVYFLLTSTIWSNKPLYENASGAAADFRDWLSLPWEGSLPLNEEDLLNVGVNSHNCQYVHPEAVQRDVWSCASGGTKLTPRRCERRHDFAKPQLGSSSLMGQYGGTCMNRDDRYHQYRSARGGRVFKTSLPAVNGVSFAYTQWACQQLVEERQPRTAILLRAHDGTVWNDDMVLNARALFAETVLRRPEKYTMHILMHERHLQTESESDAGEAFDAIMDRLQMSLELKSLVHVWTYEDVARQYEKVREWDVELQPWMAVQWWLLHQPGHGDVAHVWNWNVDTRCTGDYGELLDHVESYGRRLGRHRAGELSRRFYVEGIDSVDLWTGRQNDEEPTDEAVGEEADLITLSPIFDVTGTSWPFKDWIHNYTSEDGGAWLRSAARVASQGTNARLSRRLIELMNAENKAGRAMQGELFAPTIAANAEVVTSAQQAEGTEGQQPSSPMKSVFAPHGVYLARQWSKEQIDKTFNAGPHGQVGGGSSSIVNTAQKLQEATWSRESKWATEVYARWMGTVPVYVGFNETTNSTITGTGFAHPLSTTSLASAMLEPGGSQWESRMGKMCLPPMLLYPTNNTALVTWDEYLTE